MINAFEFQKLNNVLTSIGNDILILLNNFLKRRMYEILKSKSH